MRRMIALLLTLACSAAQAVVPAPLEPWRVWAMDGQEFRGCPLIVGKAGVAATDFICAWPGALQIQAGAHGAQFSMSWQVQAESWVPLPGSTEYWPQALTVNGQSMPVVEHEGMPQLRLKPGNYLLSGRIVWTRRPQALPVPDAIGLVRLQVDSQSIAPVQHENGVLVLGRGTSDAPEADALDLRVYRRLQDGVPMILETVIELGASGQAREELIGPVLPPGFAPTAVQVDAGWPARLEADGRLRIQVQPDTTVIRIQARALKPVLSTGIAKNSLPWPTQEIWSYAGAPEQRVTSASGAAQVDPAQAGVPEMWRALPAFALSPGVPLTIEIRSRGLGSNQSNRLQLAREAWLDFSGAGWTFQDHLSGEMHQGWRLDALAPYRLENAQDKVAGQFLLVTKGGQSATGVEWRTPQVSLLAGLRMAPASYRMPVSGWQQTFDAVNIMLHLPHGYRLIAAPGADEASGSWVSRWTLLDIFLVAIFSMFAWRALGWLGAGLTLLYLLLAYHEAGAPVYSLGIVLALGLLLRALPLGRLQRFGRWTRNALLLLLVLLAVPFAADQLRRALYPQLEGEIVQSQYQSASFADKDMQLQSPPPEEPPSAPAAADGPAELAEDGIAIEEKLNAAQSSLGRMEEFRKASPRAKNANLLDRYSQTTIVQAGRGLPNWRGGQSYQLTWSGPVTVDQSMRLLISPPWLTRLLRVLVVGLLAWVLMRLIGIDLSKLQLRKAPALASLVLLSLMPLGFSANAQAQSMPNTELLQELRARLNRAPTCAPHCAIIAAAHIDAHDGQLQVTLDIHAQSPVGVPVPMDAKSLVLDNVQVDGAILPSLGRIEKNLSLPLDRGVHRVQLSYLITGDRVALAFPMPPKTLEFLGEGWQASGISEGRLLTETLNLNRLRNQSGEQSSASPAQEFPPYVRVQRTLTLGLDWSVTTQVQRIAPQVGGFSIKLPVITGEKVLTPGLQLREGQLEIPMPDGQNTAEWSANLDKSASLSLRAPDLALHAEVWRILVSPLWRANFTGVPESVPLQENSNDWHEFTFNPLPGETLTIAATRPEPVVGSTQAIENVQLENSVGERASEYTLRLHLRASQGGERVLGLPDNAELLTVSRNAESLSLRLEKGKLSLPVQPGDQDYEVRFRDANHAGLHNRTASVRLGLPAANIQIGQSLPANRWVLLTHGPQSGPAVLYWGELLVLLLVAYGLSRLQWTPLKLRDWLLLGIGFSTFSWIALAVVVMWLFALAWRERQGAALIGRYRFDGMQLALVGLTLAAVIALITAIPYGLLGRPDMHIINPGGDDGMLHWFADQSTDALPQAGTISLPMWLYRAAMLAWALWLANAVLGWMRWAVRAWTQGGYWRPLREVAVKAD